MTNTHTPLLIFCLTVVRAGGTGPVGQAKTGPLFCEAITWHLVFYLQSKLWVNHTLNWSLETTLLVTKNMRMRARVGPRPQNGRGLGAGLIGDYRSYTRKILLNLLTVQMTSNEHRLSVFGKPT